MPRRLIIGVLVVLILGIVGGTGVLLWQRFFSAPAAPTTTPVPSVSSSLQTASNGNQNVSNPNGDDDNDGLSNADEALWGTDPHNPDTDGDGYKDGEEVKAGHNPTIAGPNDLLPPGFKPGQNLRPLDAAPDAAIPVDQYFADNLDLSGPKDDLTAAYQAKYAAADRTPTNLSNFIQSEPIITTLPTPLENTIRTQPADDPVLLSSYLQMVGGLTIFSNQTLLKQGIDDLLNKQDPSTIQAMSYLVTEQQKKLVDQPVPPSAVGLHKLLLGYSQLLAATFNLVATYPQDSVKGLLGLRQLQEIDQKYYPLIVHEVNRLQRTLPAAP